MRRLLICSTMLLATTGLAALPGGAGAAPAGGATATKAKRCPKGYVRKSARVRVGRKTVTRSRCVKQRRRHSTKQRHRPSGKRCPKGYVLKPVPVQVGRKIVRQMLCVKPAAPTQPMS